MPECAGCRQDLAGPACGRDLVVFYFHERRLLQQVYCNNDSLLILEPDDFSFESVQGTVAHFHFLSHLEKRPRAASVRGLACDLKCFHLAIVDCNRSIRYTSETDHSGRCKDRLFLVRSKPEKNVPGK